MPESLGCLRAKPLEEILWEAPLWTSFVWSRCEIATSIISALFSEPGKLSLAFYLKKLVGIGFKGEKYGKRLRRFWFVVFSVFWSIFVFLWFIIGLTWLIKAWVWIPIFVLTFLELSKSWPYFGPWTLYLLQRRYFNKYKKNARSLKRTLFSHIWQYKVLKSLQHVRTVFRDCGMLLVWKLELWNFETLELLKF